MNAKWIMLVVLMGLGLSACVEDGKDIAPDLNQKVAEGEIRSDKSREAKPNVDSKQVESLTGGQKDFSFTMYQELRQTDEGNLFYSPYSISQALTMLYAGARGDTETQMHNVLAYGNLNQQTVHPTYNALSYELESRGQGAKGSDTQPFRLKIANAVWLQRNMEVLPEYLDTLAVHYGAGMQLMDFVEDPNGSRKVINDWVEKKTENKIKNLLPDGSITSNTRMVLTNAIYFNAAWAVAFDKSQTKSDDFTLESKQTISVDMMNQQGTFNTGVAANGTRVLEMPYDGGQLSMVVLMPPLGKLAEVEGKLNTNSYKDYLASLTSKYIQLGLPKFEYEAKFMLNDPLKNMGMVDAFTDKADLSGINGQKNLSVSAVLHKAFVNVNEAGTEAAAATAVIVGETSVPMVEEDVKINQPFIFIIRDIPTGAPLFVGRVLNPKP